MRRIPDGAVKYWTSYESDHRQAVSVGEIIPGHIFLISYAVVGNSMVQTHGALDRVCRNTFMVLRGIHMWPKQSEFLGVDLTNLLLLCVDMDETPCKNHA